jgi:hypothetical protein
VFALVWGLRTDAGVELQPIIAWAVDERAMRFVEADLTGTTCEFYG